MVSVVTVYYQKQKGLMLILNITLSLVIQIKLVSGVADITELFVLGNSVTGYCKFTFLLRKRFGTHFTVMCSSTQACVLLCVLCSLLSLAVFC